MNIAHSLLAAAVVAASILSTPMVARADVSAGFNAGSTGAGLELSVPLSNHLDLRAKTGNGSVNATIDAAGNPYAGNLKLSNQTLILDIHPGTSAFVISAGAFNDGNVITAVGQPQNGTVTINGQTYTISQAGTVSASASWNSLVPYFGIGFGPTHHRAGLGLEVGAAFQGAPNVDVTATGTLATDPAFQQNLTQAKQQIQDTLSKFNVYPVIDLRYTIGI
jgi:hypothetical protein